MDNKDDRVIALTALGLFLAWGFAVTGLLLWASGAAC